MESSTVLLILSLVGVIIIISLCTFTLLNVQRTRHRNDRQILHAETNLSVNIEDVTILWNQGVQTEGEVMANRPDIIIKNNEEKTCLQIFHI